MKVVDPSGQTWRVSRRWVPWRPRRRRRDQLDPFSGLDGASDLEGLVFAVVICVVVLVVPALAIAVLLAVEILLVVLLLPLVVAVRILLGRHWHVEVRRGWRPVSEEDAGGWRASGERIRHVARLLEAGEAQASRRPS